MLSNVRFSPMSTITCLIGVVVFGVVKSDSAEGWEELASVEDTGAQNTVEQSASPAGASRIRLITTASLSGGLSPVTRGYGGPRLRRGGRFAESAMLALPGAPGNAPRGDKVLDPVAVLSPVFRLTSIDHRVCAR